MNQSIEKTSLRDSVFEKLKEDILSNKYKAGEKLCIADLKTTYDVGLSPLREALVRLSSLNFLEAISMKGYRIPIITSELVKDIYNARLHIEPYMLTLAIDRATETDEEAIIAAHHSLKKIEQCKEKADFNNWKEKHQRFLFAFMNASHSPTLINIMTNLYEQTERCRCLWFKGISKDNYFKKIKLYATYHQQLVDALLKKDKINIEKIYQTKMTDWVKDLLQYLDD
ncbi:FCD domain-containing protein [Thiotrichales bacterium 19S3-7]|nr:FCD domain-containing protein [Thiotrichales bacterium 19S3-7]MCF6801938.1 FCD domain-containing protein [Thiotrichales bacterium 19S3-11]